MHKLLIFGCFLIKSLQGLCYLGWRGTPPGYPQGRTCEMGDNPGVRFAAHSQHKAAPTEVAWYL
ncbi:hypothetical protein PSN_0443 [Pseudomonas sp. NGC7]